MTGHGRCVGSLHEAPPRSQPGSQAWRPPLPSAWGAHATAHAGGRPKAARGARQSLDRADRRQTRRVTASRQPAPWAESPIAEARGPNTSTAGRVSRRVWSSATRPTARSRVDAESSADAASGQLPLDGGASDDLEGLR
jgi:hypothetical protein